MKQESKHINNNVDVGFHCNHLHEDSLFEKVKIIIKKIPIFLVGFVLMAQKKSC